MRRTRIGIAGASILLCGALGVASAAARGTAGKPLALLQFMHKKGNAKLRSHSAARRTVRRPVAARPSAPHALGPNREPEATVAARQAPVPQSATAPQNAGPEARAAPAPTSIPQPALTAPPGPAAAISKAGVAAATAVQRAADATQSQPARPPAAAKPAPPAPMKAARSAAPENRIWAETTAPAVGTMVAAPGAEDARAVGSASWIARVLAALGGAGAAGAIAWILIGPTSRVGPREKSRAANPTVAALGR